jgi:hypothetical protein
MFGWQRKKGPGAPYPEALWVVALEEERIAVTDPEDETRSVELSDLSAVAIETNDTGPWGADFWWLFFGPDRAFACAVPQGATGEQTVVDYLKALPSFDWNEMTKAVRSTANAVFTVWERPPA